MTRPADCPAKCGECRDYPPTGAPLYCGRFPDVPVHPSKRACAQGIKARPENAQEALDL